AAAAYMDIIDQEPAKKFLDKLGFTRLAVDYNNAALSLGGTKYGMTIEENASAFSAFGNDGSFNESYMIEKITNQDGDVIYEHEDDPVDVFSPETAYLTVDMMRDVISSGTATYVKSHVKDSSVDWAGKTGTSQYHK